MFKNYKDCNLLLTIKMNKGIEMLKIIRNFILLAVFNLLNRKSLILDHGSLIKDNT